MQRGGDYIISYQGSWKHFVDCVRQGVQPAVKLEDGLRAVEAFSAALESLRTGQPQQVRPEGEL